MEGPENSRDISKVKNVLPEWVNWEGDGQEKIFLFRRISQVLEDIGFNLSQSKVLELGSGSGKLLECFKENGIDAVGVDVRPRSEAVAKQALARVEALPFQDESFDLLVSSQVFDVNVYHQYQSEMLAEILRVLKKGGLYYGAIEDIVENFPEGFEVIIKDTYEVLLRKII